MRTQKIFKVGNSWAVTIPQPLAYELHLHTGDTVIPRRTNTGILYEPIRKKGAISPEFKKWLTSFEKKYGPALKELAKK